MGVHDHGDQAHKERGALGVGGVDEDGLDGTGGFDLCEGVEDRPGDVDTHSRHPEE